MPCNNRQVCVSSSDPDYYTCNGDCLPVSSPCNGACPDNTWQCGQEECVSLDNGTVVTCGNSCQDITLPCEGKCPLGYLQCDGLCMIDAGDIWLCNGDCIPVTTPCNGTCYPGRVPADDLAEAMIQDWMGNETISMMEESGASVSCIDPSEICEMSIDQCSSDADCQEGTHS